MKGEKEIAPKGVEKVTRSLGQQPSESDFTPVTPENVADYLDAVRRRIGAKIPPRVGGGKRVQAFS